MITETERPILGVEEPILAYGGNIPPSYNCNTEWSALKLFWPLDQITDSSTSNLITWQMIQWQLCRPTKPHRGDRTIEPPQKLKPPVPLPSAWRFPQTWGGFSWFWYFTMFYTLMRKCARKSCTNDQNPNWLKTVSIWASQLTTRYMSFTVVLIN